MDAVASLENWIGMSDGNYLKRGKQSDAYRGATSSFTHSYRIATDTPTFLQQQQPLTVMQLKYRSTEIALV